GAPWRRPPRRSPGPPPRPGPCRPRGTSGRRPAARRGAEGGPGTRRTRPRRSAPRSTRTPWRGRGRPASRSRARERLRLPWRSAFLRQPRRVLLHLVDAALHVEGLLREVVERAAEDLLERADRVLEGHVLALKAGELLRDEERLREELLDLARAVDDLAVFLAQLVHAEDGDDVLQVLVLLERLLDLARDLVVALTDDARVEEGRGRVERVDGGVDAELGDRAAENRRRVEVGERRRGRRVREVVGGHVDRLHRRDGALGRRGDALLERAHLGAERRLVTDGARDAAEERRHLGARLREAEDVVDEEKDVLALLVAEVLGDGERAQGDAGARSGRLVHLAVDERGLADDRLAGLEQRLAHLDHEVGALAGALTDAGEARHATVRLRDVVDELLDEHGLADAGA